MDRPAVEEKDVAGVERGGDRIMPGGGADQFGGEALGGIGFFRAGDRDVVGAGGDVEPAVFGG